MRALVFNGPWDLTLEERPEPEPQDDEALLQILATGICGSDLHGYTGETGRRSPGQIMGHETVAEVLEDRTGQHRPGSIVTLNPVIGCNRCDACSAGSRQRCQSRRVIGVDPDLSSAFAERMVAPADRLVPLPEGTPSRLGALVEPLAVGYHAVRRAQASSSDAVFIIGAGPIGQAVALAARREGCSDIVVSELDSHRRRRIADMGFETIEANDDAGTIVSALGRSPSIVIDAVGTSTTIELGLNSAAPGASVVLVGLASPRVELAAYAVTTAERDILGSFGYSDADFRSTARWIEDREAELEPLIDSEVPLEAAPEAFRQLARGELQATKVLVLCSGRTGRLDRG